MSYGCRNSDIITLRITGSVESTVIEVIDVALDITTVTTASKPPPVLVTARLGVNR